MVGVKSGPPGGGGVPATRGFFSLVFGGREEEASASREPDMGGRGGAVLPPTNPNLILPYHGTTTIQTSLKHFS